MTGNYSTHADPHRRQIEAAILKRLEEKSAHEYQWPRWAAAEEASHAVMEILGVVDAAHSCPYPASGCTAGDCNISTARAEQRAYERGHVDGFNKALGRCAR